LFPIRPVEKLQASRAATPRAERARKKAMTFDARIDLRHLRVLRALLAENSVSRAAKVLGQSQPAVSIALRQLRDVFGDPLLVRSGAGMIRTERAEAIAEAIGRVLDEIDELVAPASAFDPATSDRHIRIVAYLGLGSVLIPAVVKQIRTEAPNARLEIVQPGPPELIKRQLQDGEVDLVIATRQAPFQNLRFAPLLESDFACILAATHHLASHSRLTLDEYLSLDHLSPSSTAAVLGSPIDGRLLDLGHKRNIVITVPEFALARYIVPGSNLVFTTVRPYAVELASNLPVKVLDAPPELGRMSAFQFWHEKSHHSAFSKWLRGTVRSVADQVFR
jgi:DNA-binding transcriptional LysR family regulator